MVHCTLTVEFVPKEGSTQSCKADKCEAAAGVEKEGTEGEEGEEEKGKKTEWKAKSLPRKRVALPPRKYHIQ